MKMKRMNHVTIIKSIVLPFILFLMITCADNGIPIGDLRGQIQGGSKRNAELVFEARDPIVALVDNGKGVLYAATSTGDVYAIRGVNKAERIYRGLVSCQTSWTAFTVTKEGLLVTNTCRDKKDIIVTLNDKGEMHDLAVLDDRVLSLARNSRGEIFVSTWQSEGNLSISLNPRSLAGAEYLSGRIYKLSPDGSLERLFEGGIPVWITVTHRDTLVASVWGGKGYFAPERKTYRYIDPYRAYWLALSDKVQLWNLTEGKKLFANTMINALTLFVMPGDDYLLGYGIAGDDQSGLFLVEENRPPIELLFQDEKLEKNITCLTLYDNVVYFGNAEGAVFRIK